MNNSKLRNTNILRQWLQWEFTYLPEECNYLHCNTFCLPVGSYSADISSMLMRYIKLQPSWVSQNSYFRKKEIKLNKISILRDCKKVVWLFYYVIFQTTLKGTVKCIIFFFILIGNWQLTITILMYLLHMFIYILKLKLWFCEMLIWQKI